MKYDVIIPFGSFCLPAMVLKKLKLRKQSLPFDWITPLTLSNAVKLMSNQFEDFLDKESFQRFDLELGDHDGYINTKTNIEFIHDFNKKIPFEDDFITFENKYKKRISRLYNLINNNKQILFVHYCEGKKISNGLDLEAISVNLETLKSLFPLNTISLLYVYLSPDFATDKNYEYNRPDSKLNFPGQVEGDPKRRSGVYTLVHEHPSTGSDRAIEPEKQFRIRSNDLSENLSVITCYKQYPEPEDKAVYWKCYLNPLYEIMRDYKLSFNLKSKIKGIPKKIASLLICLIPFRKIRKKYKEILFDM